MSRRSLRRRVVIEIIRKRRRKPDSESRAQAQAGALDLHSSAMHLYQAPHNSQAQSQPAVPSGDAAVGLTKPVEDKWQEFGRNSDPCVNHRSEERRVGKESRSRQKREEYK